MGDLTIIKAISSADIQAVKTIFLNYIEFIEGVLGQGLDFQDTKREFATFPDMYHFLLLASLDDCPVAACGVKPFKKDICELKRLYALPDGRGHGLGKKLTVEAMDEARRQGYKEMYLDTDPQLAHAVKIYQELGFTEIDRYYDNPMGCSLYMKKTL